MLLPKCMFVCDSWHKKRSTFISGMKLVSLQLDCDFISASSYGLTWYWYAIATQQYLIHTTDAWCFSLTTLRPRQNGRHFPDDIFKCIFLNENEWISIKISLKFVPKGRINNIPSLVQIMAWRRPGDKPLSEAMVVSLLTHICVTRPQWVNTNLPRSQAAYVKNENSGKSEIFSFKALYFEMQ